MQLVPWSGEPASRVVGLGKLSQGVEKGPGPGPWALPAREGQWASRPPRACWPSCPTSPTCPASHISFLVGHAWPRVPRRAPWSHSLTPSWGPSPASWPSQSSASLWSLPRSSAFASADSWSTRTWTQPRWPHGRDGRLKGYSGAETVVEAWLGPRGWPSRVSPRGLHSRAPSGQVFLVPSIGKGLGWKPTTCPFPTPEGRGLEQRDGRLL